MQGEKVKIKLTITSRKLDKLAEIMPDCEKDGTTTAMIYWAINEVIRAASVKPVPNVSKPPNYSNRDYLRDVK